MTKGRDVDEVTDTPRPVLPIVLGLVVLAFAGFQFWVSVHKYYNLEASTMDLGFFEQQLWKIAHGDWWAYSAVFQTPALGSDMSFWLYPLAYGFRYAGGALFLFGVQAAATAMAAWGVYRAALLKRLGVLTACVVALLFIFYPAVLGGSQYDFHPDFVALPFIVWAYVFYAENRRLAYYLCLLAAALAKDVVLLSIAGWGLGLILWRRRWADGMVALVGGVGLFALEVAWLIPAFFAGGVERFQLLFYGYLGHGLMGILAGVVTHFGRVIHMARTVDGAYLVRLLTPVAGVPLLGGAAVPAAAVLLVLNALSAFPPQHSLFDQYQVVLTGWLFLALVEALGRFRARVRRLALVAAAGATVIVEGFVIAHVFVPLLASRNPALPLVKAAVAHVPPHSAVWTESWIGPWAYRFPVMGTDTDVTTGLLLDPVSSLWRQGQAHGDHFLALVLGTPTNNYLGAVLTTAWAVGYRLHYRAGNIVVLVGRRPFANPPPATTPVGQQVEAPVWTLPLWTKAIRLGPVDWATGAYRVGRGPPGAVMPPFSVWLSAGLWRITLTYRAGEVGQLAPLGTFWVEGGKLHRVSLRGGQSSATVALVVRQGETVRIGLTTSGLRVFWADAITFDRVGSRPSAARS
jgi:uncharacterized membrane protein